MRLRVPDSTLGGGQVINFEARVPVLGFNVPEALILRSNGESTYHGAQFGLTQRLSRGLHFNASYTWSKSIDTSSTDPGSTAGSGKPDVPNTGFVVQGDLRNLEANRAVSDFDRTHRFSLSFVYDIPSFGSTSRFFTGWQMSGFFQAQTGTPYSIFSPEPEVQTAPQYADLVRGSGGLYPSWVLAGQVCAVRLTSFDSKAATSPRRHSIGMFSARRWAKTEALDETCCVRHRSRGSTSES